MHHKSNWAPTCVQLSLSWKATPTVSVERLQLWLQSVSFANIVSESVDTWRDLPSRHGCYTENGLERRRGSPSISLINDNCYEWEDVGLSFGVKLSDRSQDKIKDSTTLTVRKHVCGKDAVVTRERQKLRRTCLNMTKEEKERTSKLHTH